MAREFSPFVKDQAGFDKFMNELYGAYFQNAQAAAARLGTPQPGGAQSPAGGPTPPAALSGPGAAAPQRSSDAAQMQQLYKAYDPTLAERKGDPRKTQEYKDLVKQTRNISNWLAQNVNTGISTTENLMDGGGGPTRSTSSYMYDPWTGKFTKTAVDVNAVTKYGPGDTEYQEFQIGSPAIERILDRGVSPDKKGLKKGAKPADPFFEMDAIRSQIKDPKKLAEFDKLYGGVQSAQSAFQSKYLPQTLRDQVAQFFPEQGFKSSNFMGNRDYGINTLTASLANRGITDLSKLAIGKDAKGKSVIYDPLTGEGIGSGLWAYKGGSGDGNLQYYLKPNKEGTGLQLSTHFEKPEMKGIDYLDAAMPAIILAAGAGPAGAALGAGMGAAAGGLGGTLAGMGGQAVAQGIAGGLGAAMQGGDVGRGLLTGAVGGALGGAGNIGGKILGANAPAWQQAALNQGISGAVKGGLGSYLTGQNVGTGALTGGLSGAIGGSLGGLGKQFTAGQSPLAQLAGGLGARALSSGISSRLQGGDFGQGLKSGLMGGLGGLFSQQVSGLSQRAGLPPNIANNLGNLGARFAMSNLSGRG